MAQQFFTPALFTFLKDLKANNDREWFNENKQRFEDVVREPAKDFIAAFGDPLAKVTEHFVADTRTVGGSLFRIHRDTRFSRNRDAWTRHSFDCADGETGLGSLVFHSDGFAQERHER